jgi:hypothetical protein
MIAKIGFIGIERVNPSASMLNVCPPNDTTRVSYSYPILKVKTIEYVIGP